jgi:DNA polymerase eta
MSLWRVIEAEGRAFPAINISIAVSAFGDVEDGVQGIQGFLVKGPGPSKGIQQSGEKETLGKRKREDSGIAKFFSKTDEMQLPISEKAQSPEKEEKAGTTEGPSEMIVDTTLEEDSVIPEVDAEEDLYTCSRCHKKIPVFEMEEHEDYHVALELSKGSPMRAPPTMTAPQPKPKLAKPEKKGPKRKGNQIEKGQRKLEFGN